MRRVSGLIGSRRIIFGVSPLSGAWETPFQDPNDGRFWERTYPHSEMHGGGPPRLTLMSTEKVRKKYGIEGQGV
jgi:hypothetical protein